MERQVTTNDAYEIWLQTNRKRYGFDVQSDFIAVPIRSISKVPIPDGEQHRDDRQHLPGLERRRPQLLRGGRGRRGGRGSTLSASASSRRSAPCASAT